MADPISLPAIPWSQVDFMPVSPESVNRMEGRRTEAQAFGTTYWTAKYATGSLLPSQSGLFDAFIMMAGARGSHFLAYDAWRPRPIAMDKKAPLSGTKAAGGAFNGDCFFQSVSATSLSLGGLPAGFVFSPGDYIEVRKNVFMRSLHRIMQAATASAGGFATVQIMYPLDTQNFNATCTGHLEKPSCVMMIDPGSVQSAKSLDNRETSFSATEVFVS